MIRLISFVFVAHLADERRSGSDQLVLCMFAKELKAQDTARGRDSLTVGGVRFVYEGTPMRTNKIIGYAFVPAVTERQVSILNGRATARVLTPSENRLFREIRADLVRQGYQPIVSDLNGGPLS
jgi:hypothetical protein